MKTRIYRYTVVFDRFDDDDYAQLDVGESGHDGTGADAVRQFVAEMQEAIDQSGLPAGFFEVVKREVLDAETATPLGDLPKSYQGELRP